MPDRPQKITFGEMRDMGVRGLLIYCADYRCSHSIAISADGWPDDVRLSDIEARLCARPASGLSGGSIFDRADDRRENGSAGPACDQLGNDATNAQIARLRGCHNRGQRKSYDLAEHPATNQTGNNVSDRTQIEIG